MQLKIIAHIRTPFRQKFAVPRQPNLALGAMGEVVFEEGFGDANCLRGIEHFSHLWLLFAFHQTAEQGWSPTVQPPRLGGRERIGVFASRSTFRPNPIGMSVVRYTGQGRRDGRLVLRVAGVDLMDGTPILDIKPYLPYADALPDAKGGYAEEAPARVPVTFSPAAETRARALEPRYPGLYRLITEVLAQDPRPAWRRKEGDAKQYGMSLYDLNVKWRLREAGVVVLDIEGPDQAEAPGSRL